MTEWEINAIHLEGECIKNTTSVAKSSVFSTDKWVIDNRSENEKCPIIGTKEKQGPWLLLTPGPSLTVFRDCQTLLKIQITGP